MNFSQSQIYHETLSDRHNERMNELTLNDRHASCFSKEFFDRAVKRDYHSACVRVQKDKGRLLTNVEKQLVYNDCLKNQRDYRKKMGYKSW